MRDLCTPLASTPTPGGGIGNRRRNIKAAGGKCKTTKKYKRSRNNLIKGGGRSSSLTPGQKVGKAFKVIGTLAGLGGAAAGGAKIYNMFNNK